MFERITLQCKSESVHGIMVGVVVYEWILCLHCEIINRWHQSTSYLPIYEDTGIDSVWVK